MIFGVVVVNAIVGFIQESKAEAALESLRSMVRTHTKVVEAHLSDHDADRGGHEFVISRATRRVASAFRRASFEVIACDGRLL